MCGHNITAWHSVGNEKQLREDQHAVPGMYDPETLTDGSPKVEDGIREQYPDVPPPVVVADVEGQEELVADRVLAVTASTRIVGIIDVAAEALHKLVRPGNARLA